MNHFDRHGFAFPMPRIPKLPGLQKVASGSSPLPQTVGAFVLRYIALRRWHFIGLFTLVIGAAICAVLVQVGMKALVDAMAGAGERQAAGVWPLLAIFIGLIAVESILWRASGWVGSRTVIASGVDIRLDLYRHLANHSVSFFNDRFGGALGHRVTGAAGNFGGLVGTATWNIVPPCTDFVGALILFAMMDWRMAAALAMFVLMVAGGLILFGIRGRAFHQQYADQANRAGGELVDSIANMWAVKAFAARDRELRRLSGVFGEEAAVQRASWLYLEKTRAIHDVCLWAIAGGMLVFVVHLWTTGKVTPGDVVLVSALTFRILHGSRDLALALINTIQNVTFIRDALREIGAPHLVQDRPDAAALRVARGEVRMRGVTFTYAGRRTLFRDLDLVVPPGQKLGVVGTSGAGKSTLIGLLTRMYDPDHGEVIIDGQPIAHVTQDSLRSSVAVVPQDITLFHRSILENIRFGRPDASDAEVLAAAKAAHCDEFVSELPHGYETVAGERGAKLSGGQRQRIALARAILKDAPILVLDEATSALDSNSEQKIRSALSRLEKGRTVIAVAHRLSTLASYDRVIVLEGGVIVEDGTYEELQKRGGTFQRMWRLQSQMSFETAGDTAA